MAFNVLIVDDSKTVRAIVEKTLRMSGVPLDHVHHAGNGKEALDLLATQWVDIIFADINMPVMTGVQMIEKLAADGVLKSVPVVVISTEGSVTRIEELNKLGIRGYLRKPFQPEQFRSLVLETLGMTHA